MLFRVISSYSRESCYFGHFGSFWLISGCFGLFRVISGYIRVSIGGFVKRVISGFFVSSSKKLIKRVISGYSRESCYFGLFWVILGCFGLF